MSAEAPIYIHPWAARQGHEGLSSTFASSRRRDHVGGELFRRSHSSMDSAPAEHHRPSSAPPWCSTGTRSLPALIPHRSGLEPHVRLVGRGTARHGRRPLGSATPRARSVPKIVLTAVDLAGARNSAHADLTTRRDLDHVDSRIRQYRIERGRELTGRSSDEEPESAPWAPAALSVGRAACGTRSTSAARPTTIPRG